MSRIDQEKIEYQDLKIVKGTNQINKKYYF